jgi:hypothetical protein
MPNLNTLNNELSEAVLASDRLGELLAALGCDVKESRGGRVFRGRCPVHLGDDSNFSVGTDGKLFPIFWACHSHSCHKTVGRKGNLIGLIRGALTGDPDRPASMAEARSFIEEFLARDGDRPTTVRRPTTRPTPTTLSFSREQVRQQLVIPSPYFLSRGFSPAVLDRYDIGESPKLKRAVVPIYDDQGKTCVGILSRSTKLSCTFCSNCHDRTDTCDLGELRWRFEKGFPKGDYLFNYAAAKSAPVVLLVEGVGDVLRAAEAGVVAVCGFGTDISVFQTVKLSCLKRVLVAFDNDEPGQKAAHDLVPRLRRDGVHAEVRHPPAAFKDVAEMPVVAVREWLAA